MPPLFLQLLLTFKRTDWFSEQSAAPLLPSVILESCMQRTRAHLWSWVSVFLLVNITQISWTNSHPRGTTVWEIIQRGSSCSHLEACFYSVTLACSDGSTKFHVSWKWGAWGSLVQGSFTEWKGYMQRTTTSATCKHAVMEKLSHVWVLYRHHRGNMKVM